MDGSPSVQLSVSLYDDVTVSIDEGTESITIECSDPAIPCDETNTAYKAVKLFYEAVGQSVPAVRVNILKRIPSQAGMAGGSSDAAAVLKALNLLTKASLSDEELEKIAASIGADVPFCIKGGTVRATGIGTDLEELPPLPEDDKKEEDEGQEETPQPEAPQDEQMSVFDE